MLKKGEELSFRLCDFMVTLQWGKGGKKGSWQVNLTVSDLDGPLAGEEVELNLLDEAGNPLECLNPGAFLGPAPSIEWSGSRQYVPSGLFAGGDKPPVAIHVRILGHSLTVATDPGGRRKGDKGKAKDAGGGDREQPEEPSAPGKKRRAPPKCCVDQFNTPNGAQPTTHVVAAPVGSILCRPWVVTASFGSTAPCDCNCCEYRQFVRGTMTATPPGGAARDVSPILDYQWFIGPLLPGQARPLVPIRLHAQAWHVDSLGDPTNPGVPWIQYGPRAMCPSTIQDYPTPCTYWALDAPGYRNQLIGTQVNFAVEFRGEIIDTCNGGVTSGPNNWTWTVNQAI